MEQEDDENQNQKTQLNKGHYSTAALAWSTQQKPELSCFEEQRGSCGFLPAQRYHPNIPPRGGMKQSQGKHSEISRAAPNLILR